MFSQARWTTSAHWHTTSNQPGPTRTLSSRTSLLPQQLLTSCTNRGFNQKCRSLCSFLSCLALCLVSVTLSRLCLSVSVYNLYTGVLGVDVCTYGSRIIHSGTGEIFYLLRARMTGGEYKIGGRVCCSRLEAAREEIEWEWRYSPWKGEACILNACRSAAAENGEGTEKRRGVKWGIRSCTPCVLLP